MLGIQALGKQAVKASLLGNKADLLRHLSEKGDGEQQETLNLALVSDEEDNGRRRLTCLCPCCRTFWPTHSTLGRTWTLWRRRILATTSCEKSWATLFQAA